MKTYGTIPTSWGGTHVENLSRAKERLRAGLGTRRPWREMFNFHSIGLPAGFREAIGRIRSNIAYFQMNYAIVVLAILFCSLLWHPISMLVFIAMMAAWLFLYFLRDEPLVLIGRTIDDSVVMIILSVLTIVFLFLTNATLNIVISLSIGAVLVLIHAALRKTDDLFVDEESAGLLTKSVAESSSS